MPREPGGGRDHVLLGDPALEEAVGVRELERAHAAVGGEVGVEHDEILALGAEPDELVAVRVDDVLVRDIRPDACAGLGLAFERARPRHVLPRDVHELERPEPERSESLLDALAKLFEGVLERRRRPERPHASGMCRPPPRARADAP